MLIYIASSVIGLLLLVILILYQLYIIDCFRAQGHDWPTSRRAIKTIYKIISEYGVDARNFYDLGCARGKLAIAIKKKFPHLSVYAIDKTGLRLFFARLKAKFFRQKVIFKKIDLFELDLQKADIVYTYLWYDLMPPLEKKLEKELRKGALVITNTSNFANWQSVKTYITYPKKSGWEKEKLFVYIKA